MSLLAVQTAEADKKTEFPTEATLYRHTRRPEWGLAILAGQEEDRRSYQFEDGKLRKIGKGYYALLEPVEEIDGPEDIVRANLREAAKVNENRPKGELQEAVAPFEEQLALFAKLYPGGFEDPSWIADHRGSEDRAALKRHREPSMAAAQEVLAGDRCRLLLEEDRHAELAESVMDVLAGTDLVPIAHVKTLRRFDEDEMRAYAEAVATLVHGEGPFDGHFRSYLQTMENLLGGRPSWRSATALLALTHPQEHVSVRRSAFLRQAGSIAPAGRYTRKPGLGSYKAFRRVALGVKKRLEGAGQEPRDLLDVHDFVWATLRKSALEHLGA
jgi:hypothetical protein